MKNLLLFILILLIIFGGVYFLLFRDVESDETSTLYDEQRLIYQGDLQPLEYSSVVNGQVYLAFDFIKENLDDTIHFDETDSTVVITTENNVRRYQLDSLEGTNNDVAVNLRSPVTEMNGQIMLPIEAFVYDYPVDVKNLSEEKVVTIDRTDTEYMTAKVTVNTTYLREEANSDSPIVEILSEDDEVYVYGETEQWYKVRKIEGKAGYIRKRHLELSYELEGFSKTKEETQEVSRRDEKINLVWDYTAVRSSNEVDDLVGVNVISPTWFSLNEDLSISDRSNIEYVNRSKSYGMEVWPMFDNNFEERLTENALSTSSNRQQIIAQVLDICKSIGVNGINVDFENINVQTRENFSQFMRELYPLFKEAGMTVSVDVVPRIFSDVEKEPYDRNALAKASDYIMLMAYDQHWGTSPVAGSVAEYSWVENNMNVLFRDIPMEKFVLCVPLYTRIWFDDGANVTSQSVSMEVANEYIRNNNMETSWDDNAKQHYASKQVGGSFVQIWLEDADSLREKASLVSKYDLAGVSSWRKGFETSDVWPVINSNIQ